MATEAKSFHLDHSHSKTVSKNTSSLTSKMQNISNEKGEQLLKKALIRKRTQCPENATESKPFKDSKKASISTHNQQNQELLKVVRNETEKLNIKENKCKSSTNSKLCFCSPTTHEGSFRCRLHRISTSAAKKPATEKSNLRCSKRANGMVEFKPQLSRFGRIASAEVGPHDSLMQLPGVESV